MATELINDHSSSDEGLSCLRPTKIFFLKSSSGDFSDELHVMDLTSLVRLADYTGTITDALRKQVEHAAQAKRNDSSASAFELTRGTFSSCMQIHDSSADPSLAAELDMPILKRYSEWTMRFAPRSSRTGCDVKMRPVSVWKKQETFAMDGVPYLWDMSGGSKRGVLTKECKGQTVPVAEFVAKTWFDNSCVLMLDEEQVEDVVALTSCVAVLNRGI